MFLSVVTTKPRRCSPIHFYYRSGSSGRHKANSQHKQSIYTTSTNRLGRLLNRKFRMLAMKHEQYTNRSWTADMSNSLQVLIKPVNHVRQGFLGALDSSGIVILVSYGPSMLDPREDLDKVTNLRTQQISCQNEKPPYELYSNFLSPMCFSDFSI